MPRKSLLNMEIILPAKEMKASDFTDKFYYEYRGLSGGRSRNLLTNLKITIDGDDIGSSDDSVYRLIKEKLPDKLEKYGDLKSRVIGITKNSVRIDLVYKICKIISESEADNHIIFRFDIYGIKTSDREKTDNPYGYNPDGFDKDDGFYEMVKHWMVSDHFNPTIRSEMIWDMLLSDFICDLMREHIKDGRKIILIAKEFPYINGDGNISKVDYLVGVDKNLYFVELKTTRGSFNPDQFHDYMKYQDFPNDYNLDKILERYKKLIPKLKSENDRINYYEFAGPQKYRYQIERMKYVCGKEGKKDDEFLEWFRSEYNREIKLIYIVFEEDTVLKEKGVEQIVLSSIVDEGNKDDSAKLMPAEEEGDAESDEKCHRWDMVMDIIREAMRGDMPKRG